MDDIIDALTADGHEVFDISGGQFRVKLRGEENARLVTVE